LGHPVLATAAYNAGPGRARRWRADMPLEGAIYAESIPFNETRDYVKKVMGNAWYYAHQLGMPRVSLRDMMGTVASKNGRDISAVTRYALDAKDANGAELGIFGLSTTVAPPVASVPVPAPAAAPTTSAIPATTPAPAPVSTTPSLPNNPAPSPR
jgi:hypothetical protein